MMPLGACRRFFEEQPVAGMRLVLGFSGGPDSFALMDACHRLSADYGYTLIIAHLDHGWRPSSAAEAAEFQQRVEERGLLWECSREKPSSHRNVEDQGRNARLRFFRQVCDQHQAHAVLLAHQQDDLVETTLKRVLEGASLDKLHGLRKRHEIDGLRLWRPLLMCPRSAIEKYARQRKLPVFKDPSNQDVRFLRNRMRQQLIPQIEALFGKGIRRPLLMLAEQSLELEQQNRQDIRQGLESVVLRCEG